MSCKSDRKNTVNSKTENLRLENSIPFIDLNAQQQRIRSQLDASIARVMDHGKYIMGPEIAELESALCNYTGSKHCITVSNGTDAIVAALMAYDVGPGDAIITTPFTFFATIEAIMMLGATPVFADIDLDTFNICPNEVESVVKKVRSENKLNLRGIIPVDLFGLCADYASINRIADENGLFVIQDAAQSFGAEFDGKKAPNHADIGTTSFFPAKPLGCYGDGGAVFTNDDALADKLRSVRVHGKGIDKYDNIRVGMNARLDTIQAAVLIEKLKIYPDEFERRQEVAANYSQLIESANQSNGNTNITIPKTFDGHRSAWAQYTIRTSDRDTLSTHLKECGIPSVVYYRTPSHLLGACKSLNCREGDFPNSERAANEVLSLPFHPYLEATLVLQIVSQMFTPNQIDFDKSENQV